MLVCVCVWSAGRDEGDKLLAEPWQFLSNYQSLISHCTVKESASHPSNKKKGWSALFSSEWISSYVCVIALNEGAATRMILYFLSVKVASAVRTNWLHRRSGQGGAWMISFWITLGKQADLFVVRVARWEHAPGSVYQPVEGTTQSGKCGRAFPTQSITLLWLSTRFITIWICGPASVFLKGNKKIEKVVQSTLLLWLSNMPMLYGPQKAVFTYWCRGSQESRCPIGRNRFDRSKCWLLPSRRRCGQDTASRSCLPVWTWRCQGCKLVAKQRKKRMNNNSRHLQ